MFGQFEISSRKAEHPGRQGQAWKVELVEVSRNKFRRPGPKHGNFPDPALSHRLEPKAEMRIALVSHSYLGQVYIIPQTGWYFWITGWWNTKASSRYGMIKCWKGIIPLTGWYFYITGMIIPFKKQSVLDVLTRLSTLLFSAKLSRISSRYRLNTFSVDKDCLQNQWKKHWKRLLQAAPRFVMT